MNHSCVKALYGYLVKPSPLELTLKIVPGKVLVASGSLRLPLLVILHADLAHTMKCSV